MSDLTVSLDLGGVTLHPEPKHESPPRYLLTPIPDAPGEFLFILDNTAMEKWKRCAAAANYYLVLRREAHAKNAALTFGGALHEGLELFHQQQWLNARSPGVADDHCNFLMQDAAIRQYFLDNPTPHDEYRTVNNAIEVMAHYRRRCDEALYPDYNWTIFEDSNGPIIERAFELPLGVIEINAFLHIPGIDPAVANGLQRDEESRFWVSSVHVAWAGRIDVAAYCNNRARIVDHKTTSIDGDQFIQSFQLSSQTIGYLWAGRQLWPDLDLSGFCLNALRLKKPNVGAISLVAPGSRGGEPALKFFRSYFEYSPERLAEWHHDTLAHVEDFFHCLVRGHFPLNDRQCFDKFGRCPYHDICSLDDLDMRQRMLMSDAYKSVTWDPTAGR